ncbi:MAG: hypothetical protein AB1656_23605 [Candidatus Omnitrophota bacterium]
MHPSSHNPKSLDEPYLINRPDKTAIMRVFVERPLVRLAMADLARVGIKS